MLVEQRRWMLWPFQGLEPPAEMEDGFGRVSVFVAGD
jgi:hypothetical protein